MIETLFLNVDQPLEMVMCDDPEDPPGMTLGDGDGGVYLEGDLTNLLRVFLSAAVKVCQQMTFEALVKRGSGADVLKEAAKPLYHVHRNGPRTVGIQFPDQDQLMLTQSDDGHRMFHLLPLHQHGGTYQSAAALRAGLLSLLLADLPPATNLSVEPPADAPVHRE